MTNEELIEQLRNGGDRQQIMLQLYEKNRGLIFQTIKPYIRNDNTADLMQTTYLGLHEAAERYVPDRGSFATYLPHWIRATVNRSFRDMSVRLPEHVRSLIVKYNRLCSQYQAETGSTPSDYFLRMRLRITQNQLDALRQSMQQVGSLDYYVTDDLTVADTVADTKDDISDLLEKIDKEQAARELWHEVDGLEGIQGTAIRKKYIDGKTVQQIADDLSITKSQAQGEIVKACNKLRRKKNVKRIAELYGCYSTNDLYGCGLSSFLYYGSRVEMTAIKQIESEANHDKQKHQQRTERNTVTVPDRF